MYSYNNKLLQTRAKASLSSQHPPPQFSPWCISETYRPSRVPRHCTATTQGGVDAPNNRSGDSTGSLKVDVRMNSLLSVPKYTAWCRERSAAVPETRGATTAEKLKGTKVWVPKAGLSVGCRRGSPPPSLRVRRYHPRKNFENSDATCKSCILVTTMLSISGLPRTWNFLLFKLRPRSWGTNTLLVHQPKSWITSLPPSLRLLRLYAWDLSTITSSTPLYRNCTSWLWRTYKLTNQEKLTNLSRVRKASLPSVTESRLVLSYPADRKLRWWGPAAV